MEKKKKEKEARNTNRKLLNPLTKKAGKIEKKTQKNGRK